MVLRVWALCLSRRQQTHQRTCEEQGGAGARLARRVAGLALGKHFHATFLLLPLGGHTLQVPHEGARNLAPVPDVRFLKCRVMFPQQASQWAECIRYASTY